MVAAPRPSWWEPLASPVFWLSRPGNSQGLGEVGRGASLQAGRCPCPFASVPRTGPESRRLPGPGPLPAASGCSQDSLNSVPFQGYGHNPSLASQFCRRSLCRGRVSDEGQVSDKDGGSANGKGLLQPGVRPSEHLSTGEPQTGCGSLAWCPGGHRRLTLFTAWLVL